MSARPTGPQVPIRQLREAHGLSVRELVQRIQDSGQPVHEDHLRNVERGRKQASAPLMLAWARALGLHPLDVWQPPREADTGESDSTTEEGAA